jgi:hypothetical protein
MTGRSSGVGDQPRGFAGSSAGATAIARQLNQGYVCERITAARQARRRDPRLASIKLHSRERIPFRNVGSPQSSDNARLVGYRCNDDTDCMMRICNTKNEFVFKWVEFSILLLCPNTYANQGAKRCSGNCYCCLS